MNRYLTFTTESAALRERLTDFINLYTMETDPHPFTEQLRIHRNLVVLDVVAWDGAIQLGSIQSLFPGKGAASVTLDWLTSAARHYRVDICGKVDRIGTTGLNKRALLSWYRRHGFVIYDGFDMVYTYEGKK